MKSSPRYTNNNNNRQYYSHFFFLFSSDAPLISFHFIYLFFCGDESTMTTTLRWQHSAALCLLCVLCIAGERQTWPQECECVYECLFVSLGMHLHIDNSHRNRNQLHWRLANAVKSDADRRKERKRRTKKKRSKFYKFSVYIFRRWQAKNLKEFHRLS